MTSGFIDIHHHLAFGLDDGPRTYEEAEAQLFAAAKDGIERIIATPHLCPGEKSLDITDYHERLRRLNECCQRKALPLFVYPGAELFYTEAALRLLREGRVPTLASSAFVLVEFETDVTYERLFQAARTLSNAGYVPVLAHVERYACLVRHWQLAVQLKETLSLRMQMNCTSILHPKGFFARRFIREALGTGLIDYVATDAHNTITRPCLMRECYRRLHTLYGPNHAQRLTTLNQEEIFI